MVIFQLQSFEINRVRPRSGDRNFSKVRRFHREKKNDYPTVLKTHRRYKQLETEWKENLRPSVIYGARKTFNFHNRLIFFPRYLFGQETQEARRL